MTKKTLVVGASTNSERYSYKAAVMLLRFKHPIVLVGKTKGAIEGVAIQSDFPAKEEEIHTVTLYINPMLQTEIYKKILELNPKRIIFNPGTENEELMQYFSGKGIEVVEGCTLVLLSTGQY